MEIDLNSLRDKIVFKLLEINTSNLFTTEILHFIFLIVGIIFGILLCFVGYKMFGLMIMAVEGLATGYVGLYAAVRMTDVPVLQMFVTVMIMFVLVCGFYFGYMILSKSFGMLPNSTRAARHAHIITPLLGGALLGMECYFFIFRYLPAALAISAAFAILGILIQKNKTETKRTFHTYEDLIRRSPQERSE